VKLEDYKVEKTLKLTSGRCSFSRYSCCRYVTRGVVHSFVAGSTVGSVGGYVRAPYRERVDLGVRIVYLKVI
jgi:hypothetical protein